MVPISLFFVYEFSDIWRKNDKKLIIIDLEVNCIDNRINHTDDRRNKITNKIKSQDD